MKMLCPMATLYCPHDNGISSQQKIIDAQALANWNEGALPNGDFVLSTGQWNF